MNGACRAAGVPGHVACPGRARPTRRHGTPAPPTPERVQSALKDVRNPHTSGLGPAGPSSCYAGRLLYSQNRRPLACPHTPRKTHAPPRRRRVRQLRRVLHDPALPVWYWCTHRTSPKRATRGQPIGLFECSSRNVPEGQPARRASQPACMRSGHGSRADGRLMIRRPQIKPYRFRRKHGTRHHASRACAELARRPVG